MDQKSAWEALHKKQDGYPNPGIEFLAFMSEYFWEKKDLKFLDLGAGTGASTLWLSERNISVVAVEMAETACGLIKRRLSKNSCAEIVNSNILDINFEKNSFDAILALGVLECVGLDNSIELIQRAKDWLKPNGHILAKIIAQELPEEINHKDDKIEINIYTPYEIGKIFDGYDGAMTLTTKYLSNWKPVHNYIRYATLIK